MNYNAKDELPMGFGMALAMNPEAMKAFSALPELGQKQYLDRASAVTSRDEMDSLVRSLTHIGGDQGGAIG